MNPSCWLCDGPPFEHVEELREYFANDDHSNWRAWAIVRTGEDFVVGFLAEGQNAKVGLRSAICSRAKRSGMVCARRCRHHGGESQSVNRRRMSTPYRRPY